MASISAILMAAGESTRMGYPKPLLPWNDTTLIQYQITSLFKAGVSEVAVVLGHEYETIMPYVELISEPRILYVLNHDYRLGKTTSVKAGLHDVSTDATDIVLLAVDQPRPSRIIETIIRSHENENSLITSPTFMGHLGHPLIFSAELKSELESISEEHQGIRGVFDSHKNQVNEIPIEDPVIRLDLNTYEVYEEAKSRFRP